MFKNTFQSGFLSILYSLRTKPLQIWDKEGASSSCLVLFNLLLFYGVNTYLIYSCLSS
uniref:CFA20 domain-containing protein n=1 Tax=Arundo donax TaxID=35708 RepID=A0A0A9GBS9_ARUDO